MKNYCPVEPSEFKKSSFPLMGDGRMIFLTDGIT
ncbi:unknown [Eubacterium sp. CAG:841]|nr:unknown [Eubacterium sp. CAG:841]